MTRSPFFYVGDKYKLMKQLSSLFPTNINRLIEPFCGGGSVFLNTKANAYLENDANLWMIKLHRFLLKQSNNRKKFFSKIHNLIIQYGLSASYLNITVPIELKKKYIKTHYAVYNKTAYSKLKEDFNNNQNDMFLLYLLLIYGFNHMLRFNSKGLFNLPVGNVDYNKNVFNALNAYFDFANSSNIVFSCLDYKQFIRKITFDKNDFVYLDPPYLISNSEYNKSWDENCEKNLLKTIDELNKRSVKFALSNVLSHKGLKNHLLIEWSKKYKIHYLKSNYISYFDNSLKRDTIEVLITNY